MVYKETKTKIESGYLQKRIRNQNYQNKDNILHDTDYLDSFSILNHLFRWICTWSAIIIHICGLLIRK